jgi:Family of unknown function (DUF6941)
MARIDWAVLCDLAFFDRQDRLCVIGVVERLPAPSLPLAINQMMLVARLTDLRLVEEIGISVAVITPDGSIIFSDDCVIEMVHEYVLVTVRSVPLREEGLYRFRIALTSQAPVYIDVPVLSLADRPVALPH